MARSAAPATRPTKSVSGAASRTRSSSTSGAEGRAKSASPVAPSVTAVITNKYGPIIGPTSSCAVPGSTDSAISPTAGLHPSKRPSVRPAAGSADPRRALQLITNGFASLSLLELLDVFGREFGPVDLQSDLAELAG